MDARIVARRLRQLALLLELAGENPFKVKAFATGSQAVERLWDLDARVAEGRLREVKGLGPALAEVIADLVTTGRSAVETDLRARVPVGVRELAGVPGLGTTRLAALRAALDVHDPEGLEAACQANRLLELPGFGAKTQEKILEALPTVRARRGLYLALEAEAEAAALERALAAHPAVTAVAVAGELRRGHGVVRGLDLVAATADPSGVLDAFAALPGLAAVARRDERHLQACLDGGMRVDLRVASEQGYAWALLEATGPLAHLEAVRRHAAAQGWQWDAEGLHRDGQRVGASEAALYAALDLPYHPPEAREAGLQACGPLVATADLVGAWHVHTTYSDGLGTLEEMVAAARAHGWQFLGIADHSQSAVYAGGLTVERIREQRQAIDRLNAAGGLMILQGIESDILADGSLDYPAEILDGFDFVVASVHTRLGMDREEMTARLVKAMHDPHVTVLGHPTGRLLLERPGYALDMDRIYAAAVETGVALEINASPERLDLDAAMVAGGAARGVRFAINPDAHSVAGLGDLRRGVAIARQAGLAPDMVVNTRPWPAARPSR